MGLVNHGKISHLVLRSSTQIGFDSKHKEGVEAFVGDGDPP